MTTATRDARSLPALAQEDLRRKAVNAVAEGMTQTEAARLFGVSRVAVNGWVKRWREGGARTLKARPQGRPRGSRLAPHQAATIVRLVVGRCPDQLQLRFARVSIRVLKRLLRNRGARRLFLIVDQHPVHKAKGVQRWIATRGQRLTLFYLPGYSPQLNPDELLNQDVKSNALGRRRPASQ